MADTPEDLLAAFRKDERLLNALEDAVFDNALQYRRAVEDSMLNALRQLITRQDENGRSIVVASAENRVILNRIERQLPEILEGSGLAQASDDIVGIMRDRLNTLDNLVEDAGIPAASGTDFERLPQIQNEIDTFTSKLRNASPEVEDIVRRQINIFRNDIDAQRNMRFTELRNTLINKANILPRYAGTIGNTQLAALDRVGRDLQADRAGIKHLRYSGVLDGLTRPFCRQNLDRVETREVWASMQNNVRPQPVLKYCGGFNCRHRLILWRPEWESPETAMQS